MIPRSKLNYNCKKKDEFMKKIIILLVRFTSSASRLLDPGNITQCEVHIQVDHLETVHVSKNTQSFCVSLYFRFGKILFVTKSRKKIFCLTVEGSSQEIGFARFLNLRL